MTSKRSNYDATMKPINEILDLFEAAITSKDYDAQSKEKVSILLNKVDEEFITNRGGHNHWVFLLSAMKMERLQKAVIHLRRVRKALRRVANDDPFEPGDFVHVRRTRHGWNFPDDVLRITKRYVSEKGSFSYLGRSKTGSEYEIEHTRDAYRALESEKF